MKNINWLDHGVNLIVVFIGITAAFGLNTCNENSKAKDLEVLHLKSLRGDLEENIDELDTLIHFDSLKMKLFNRVVNAEFIKNPHNDSLRNALLDLSFNLPFTPQSSTYDALQASGTLDLISNFNLRTDIISHYNQYYVGTELWDAQIQKYIDDYCSPYIFEEVNYYGQQVDPSFIEDYKFQKIVWGYKLSLASKIDFFQKTLVATKALDLKIRNELERL